MRLFLVVIEGDVEPEVFGECLNDEHRIRMTRKYRKEKGDEDGLFRLNVDENGTPEMESFGSVELDE